MTYQTVLQLLPEILLVAFAVAIYVGSAFSDAQRGWNRAALAGVVLAACALATVHYHPAGGYPLFQDGLALFARWMALALAALYILLSFKPLPGGGTPEMFGSLLLIVAGVMLAAAAADLVLIFVSLELISIPTYILLYLGRRDALQQESAAKYFYLSVLSSAILLYGFSFLYGLAGSTDLHNIHDVFLDAGGLPQGFELFAKLAAVLAIAGLSFRLTAVPFHFYAPDVYQGTTHANAALLSVIPKLAGLAVLVRIAWWAMPDGGHLALGIVAALAVLSMTLGNVLALWQDNLRRLMAYSSIAHAGYLLLGLAAALAMRNIQPGAWDGIGAMMFYLCVYAAATIGTFAVFEHLGGSTRRVEGIDELAGLGREKPTVAAMLAAFMFSLTGIPILAGFWGKFQIFGSALSVASDAETAFLRPLFIALAVVGVLNAAVSAAYYLRIVGAMYFRAPLGKFRAEGGTGALLAAALCCLLVLGLGLYPRPLLRASDRARPQLEIVGQVSNLSHPK
ncbi:MAG: NADH-quinone oxidoreductase subunit N [Pirellulales bacterium]|nr:NADH-quinone oxidoreductase subunit N [Pirellulales bacterium]